MKTHAELADDVVRLESECRTLEIAAMDRGQMAKGRPMLSSDATTEQLVQHASFLETYAADLRIQDRLSRPLKGVPNSTPKAATTQAQQTVPQASPAATAGPTATQRIVASGGARATTIKAEVAKLEVLLPRMGGTSKAALETKLARLRSELAGISPETPAPKLTATQEQLVVGIVAMRGLVKNSKPNGQAAKSAQARLEKLSAELKATGVDPETVTAKQ